MLPSNMAENRTISAVLRRRYIICLVILATSSSLLYFENSNLNYITSEIQVGVREKTAAYTKANTYSRTEPNEHTEELTHQYCLSLDFDEDMDNLLSKFKQVFLIFPAKAAGSSLKLFAQKCMDTKNATTFTKVDNIINFPEKMQSALLQQLELPSLMASHMYTSKAICDVMKHATRESLIVFSHREETDKLKSAIKHVMKKRICFPPGNKKTACSVPEKELVHKIRMKYAEIAHKNSLLLTCGTYQCIRENRANVVFMNYKQASKMQKLLAKHHCPKYTMDVRVNTDAEIIKPISVVLNNDNETLVPLDKWVDVKAPLLELVLNLKKDMSCQGTTRKIEDGLFACPHETLLMSGQSCSNCTTPFPL